MISAGWKSFAGSRKNFAALEEDFAENLAALEEIFSLLSTKRLLTRRSLGPPLGGGGPRKSRLCLVLMLVAALAD